MSELPWTCQLVDANCTIIKDRFGNTIGQFKNYADAEYVLGVNSEFSRKIELLDCELIELSSRLKDKVDECTDLNDKITRIKEAANE